MAALAAASAVMETAVESFREPGATVGVDAAIDGLVRDAAGELNGDRHRRVQRPKALLDVGDHGWVALDAGGSGSAALLVGVGVRVGRRGSVASAVAFHLPSEGRWFTTESPGDRAGGLVGCDSELDLDAFGQRQRFAWHAENLNRSGLRVHRHHAGSVAPTG